MPTPPRNPYIAGKALGDTRGFFGREDVFRLVETVLSSPDQNSVVLFGQRRIGKTSILLNLRARLASKGFVPVYFDLMDRARKSLADVLYELAATIAQELSLQQPVRADFDDEGRTFREKFLPMVYAALSDNRLVLLFDEFDVLDVAQEEQLPTNAAARAFFPYLRGLMAQEPRLGFVFVVGRKAEDLGIEFKAAFKASRSQRVSVLDEESARSLVLRAEQEDSLRFDKDAVPRVLTLTARHPYFTQLMCQLLFERAYQAAPSSTPTVTATDVEAIVPKALEAAENVFEWIWDGLPPAERVIFSAVATGTDEQSVITDEPLMSILQSQGIRVLIRELELAPKALVEWEMLRQTDGGYKFFVELMRRWVVERKSLDKVKDELDRVAPLADMLYQAANGFYRRGDLERATAQLQNALNVNPNHIKARLLLGEIFRGQGKLDDAVRELEQAYRIDENASRLALESTLVQSADASEKQNRADDALRDYARVLMISPNNQNAKERRSAIWLSRGEAALQVDDLETALAAFQESGITHKVAEILALRLKRGREEAAKEAELAAQREEWEKAAEVYSQLVEQEPEEQLWQEKLEYAKIEWNLARRYAEGLGAMQRSKWVEAQRAFADVVSVHPSYKDAAHNLAKATAEMKAIQAVDEVKAKRVLSYGKRLLALPIWNSFWTKASIVTTLFSLLLLCILLILYRAQVLSVAEVQATSAVQAQALANMQSQATATIQAQATATAQAQATATAQAQVTATAQAQAIIAAQANATETAIARAESTAVAEARTTAIAQAKLTQTAIAQLAIRRYDLGDGKLSPTQGVVAGRRADVSLRNLIVEARFYNPYDQSKGKWDYGFFIRHTGKSDQYRVCVTSDANWQLLLANPAGDQWLELIAKGKVANLALKPGDSNYLYLMVRDEIALFFVNGEYIATLDVSRKRDPGDVYIGSGFNLGYFVEGQSTRYEGFIVWSLP